MDKKECVSCEQVKPLSMYRRDKRLKDGRQSSCKCCVSARNKVHYRDKYRDKHCSDMKIARNKNKQLLLQYKQQCSCTHCGNNDHRVLDFHHVEGKDRNVSAMATCGYGWQIILDEIAKCIPLCSNCHRILHYKEAHNKVYE